MHFEKESIRKQKYSNSNINNIDIINDMYKRIINAMKNEGGRKKT